MHFVAPDEKVWEELRTGDLGAVTEEKLADYTVGSLNGWVIRTYFHLRRAGAEPTLGPLPIDDAINVVSPRDFGRRQRRVDHFIVVPRADGHRPMLSNFYLEQNEVFPAARHRDNILYWPQAGIIPRSPERRGSVSTVVFKGRNLNLDAVYRDDAFRAELEAHGMTLETDAFDGLLGRQSWRDYREADVVLAVRNLTRSDAEHKPASKLVNAWFAEVPAILGPEPAYRALRRSEYDYLEASNPKEVIAALLRLRDEPGLYEKMVDNARVRRAEFTVERVLDRWFALLNGRIAEDFRTWQALSRAERTARWTFMMASEPVAKWFYSRGITRGERICDGSLV